MTLPTPARRPFVDPVVSEPIDALKATTAFGGLTAPLLLGPLSSGVGALDDGDLPSGADYFDSYQDGVDGGSYNVPYDSYPSL